MKRVRAFILLLLAIVLIQPVFRSQAAAKTVVVWYIGLGAGMQHDQITAEKKVAERFNLSQDKIELRLSFADGHPTAADILNTLIASGQSPDIVGPVGFAGANVFEGQWLDLQPLVDKTGYNLKQFPDNVVAHYREGNALIGLPFAVFPGVIYYNVDLFDEAGLAYPPARFGEKYKLDGKEMDWDYDTLALLAKKLTRDNREATPNDPGFDPEQIVQFGFLHQWDTMRSDFSTFGGAPVVNLEDNVAFPAAWREQARWMWNGIWKEHFIPNTAYLNSRLLQQIPFSSGKIAMVRSMLWFTCCLNDLKAKWDFAVVPSYKGQTYAPMDVDMFRIMKASKNPEAAFTVLQYLHGEAASELLKIYDAPLARADLQADYTMKQQKRFPFVQNWNVPFASLEYAAVPNHESLYPNFTRGQQRFDEFRLLFYSDAGKGIDVDMEFDKLQADIERIVKTGR